ncbi:MAG: DMT family transporter [Clostridiales bacterium]|nr:DMT family transporter [Clostridiales bacterium]MDY4060137.1 DMT family transporter [Anaerovoracaceae bacterium]
MKKRRIAELGLILVTLGWGVSYYLMDISLTEMGPFTLNGYRFLIAFFVAGIFSFSYIKDVNRETLKYSFYLGTLLLFVYSGATFGVKYTTLSNAGFLCALAVVITPFVETVFMRKPLPAKVQISATACLIGIMLMTLKDNFAINMENLPGDLLCIMCAVSYSFHILVTQKAVQQDDVNPYQLGVFQLLFCGVYCMAMGFIAETPAIPSNMKVGGSVLFLAVFCTGVAFIVQAVAQKYTEASRVGIIFSLEPVFAGIVAYIFADERLSIKGYVGVMIMLSAILFLESNFSFLKLRKTDNNTGE